VIARTNRLWQMKKNEASGSEEDNSKLFQSNLHILFRQKMEAEMNKDLKRY
jgi:hypothetical protein